LADVLEAIERLSAEYGLAVANVFHAGDGNLHPLVCYDPGVPGEGDRALELAGAILRECVARGGSITGEHGVGVDKSTFMSEMFSHDDLDSFARLRCAFDPAGLANPGKLIPTPRLCGERPGPYQQHPLEQSGLATRF
jgi:glycolate oxidase